MDKKKTFLVLIISALLALMAAYVINKNSTTSVITEPTVQEEAVVTEEDDAHVDILPVEDIEAEQAEEKKETIKPVTKTTSKTNPIATNTAKIEPIKIQEATIVVEEEQKIDPGIYKESGTNNIVITREFKVQSRNKYLFEGFGIQKAPTK